MGAGLATDLDFDAEPPVEEGAEDGAHRALPVIVTRRTTGRDRRRGGVHCTAPCRSQPRRLIKTESQRQSLRSDEG
ncbi:hypothetical protein Afil01_30600 [Actinorhabdospora filicis]|uniref:Uncharacterized protein n=1 Tax=Actinorhabdospora filicis TaxID=1785913 RepID=A0A9W6SLL7_9ACTN|nr:hypothetical protein Afil01_30600 [Actinorhabdospora filicis]